MSLNLKILGSNLTPKKKERERQRERKKEKGRERERERERPLEERGKPREKATGEKSMAWKKRIREVPAGDIRGKGKKRGKNT